MVSLPFSFFLFVQTVCDFTIFVRSYSISFLVITNTVTYVHSLTHPLQNRGLVWELSNTLDTDRPRCFWYTLRWKIETEDIIIYGEERKEYEWRVRFKKNAGAGKVCELQNKKNMRLFRGICSPSFKQKLIVQLWLCIWEERWLKVWVRGV